MIPLLLILATQIPQYETGMAFCSVPGLCSPVLAVAAQMPAPPAPASARPRVQVVVTHQPSVSFQALYGAKLPGVGLYQVRVCSVDQAITLSGSRVLTMAAKHVAPIDSQLIPTARSRARQRSWKWRVARAATWAAWLGAMVTTGGASSIITVTAGVAQAIPIVGIVADRLGTEVRGDDATALQVRLLGEEDSWTLEAGGCKSGVFWGAWRSGQGEIFTEVVTVP